MGGVDKGLRKLHRRPPAHACAHALTSPPAAAGRRDDDQCQSSPRQLCGDGRAQVLPGPGRLSGLPAGGGLPSAGLSRAARRISSPQALRLGYAIAHRRSRGPPRRASMPMVLPTWRCSAAAQRGWQSSACNQSSLQLMRTTAVKGKPAARFTASGQHKIDALDQRRCHLADTVAFDRCAAPSSTPTTGPRARAAAAAS